MKTSVSCSGQKRTSEKMFVDSIQHQPPQLTLKLSLVRLFKPTTKNSKDFPLCHRNFYDQVGMQIVDYLEETRRRAKKCIITFISLRIPLNNTTIINVIQLFINILPEILYIFIRIFPKPLSKSGDGFVRIFFLQYFHANCSFCLVKSAPTP